jgi:hypothetical protein
MASQSSIILNDSDNDDSDDDSKSNNTRCFIELPKDAIYYKGDMYKLAGYEYLLKFKVFKRSDVTYNWDYAIYMPITDSVLHHKCFSGFIKSTLPHRLISKKYASAIQVEYDDVNINNDLNIVVTVRNYLITLDQSVVSQISNNWRSISESECTIFLHTVCVEDNMLRKTTVYFEVTLFNTLSPYAQNIVGMIVQQNILEDQDKVEYIVHITGDFTFGWMEGGKLTKIVGAAYNKRITNLLYYAIKQFLSDIF